MKKTATLLGAATIALLMAAPAQASEGYAGASFMKNDDLDTDAVAISGAVVFGENFQFDAGYAELSDIDTQHQQYGGHFFVRGDNSLWGGYIGAGRMGVSGDNLNEFTAAVETQYYLDRTTLSGSVSYSKSDFIIDDITLTAVEGEARHFLNDNFSFQGNVGYGRISMDGFDSTDGWSGGVGAELQFSNSPMSVYGGIQHSDFDGATADSFGIGVRWNFGSASLFERNRSGAGLNRETGFLGRALGEFVPR